MCFSNEDGSPSPAFYHFIGGLQRYLPKTMPFLPVCELLPPADPYPRADQSMQWGFDNRTVGLRVPHSAQRRQVENRVPGVDVNPYIAMAASLACGYLGMVNQIDCAEPVQINAYSLPTSCRATEDALEQLKACPEIAGLGPRFVELYIAMKEKEFSEYFRVISPWGVNSCCCVLNCAIHPILSQIIPLAHAGRMANATQNRIMNTPAPRKRGRRLTPPIICIRSLTPIRSIGWAAGWWCAACVRIWIRKAGASSTAWPGCGASISAMAARELAEAAYQQMLELPFYSRFKTTHPPVIDCQSLLAQADPAAVQPCFDNSGSESNDTVIRTARHFWGRKDRLLKKS